MIVFARSPFPYPDMNKRLFLVVILVLASSGTGLIAAKVYQDRKTKKVTRVKRPQFTQRDWDGIYFENLFKDGLVGNRPSSAEPGAVAKSSGQPTTPGTQPTTTGEFAWSKYIAGSTIEDEVKTLQGRLITDVTTPVKFKSNYAKAHQSFSMLSMMFGVIREYDDEVRWKKFAGSAQASFERAAANSRVGTTQAYESCKRRRDDLQEMVRGGNFAGDDKAPESLDWSTVVDRNALMERLQESEDNLKQLTANKGEFTGDITKVYHESQMVAAMAQTLLRENMQDADEETYMEYAKSMSDAAVSISKACQTQDYDAASNAVNLMSQSCNNCHDDWR